MDDGKAVIQRLVQNGLLEPDEAQEIMVLDQLIGAYHCRLALDGRYMPQNFQEQRTLFVQQQGTYIPTFSYKTFPVERGYERIEEIKNISSALQQKSWISRCMPLYHDKVQELYTQIQTLVAWEEQRDADMRQSLLTLFPVCSEDVWKECEDQVRRFFAKTAESMRSVDTMKSVETVDAAEHMESKTRYTGSERKAYTEEALKHAGLSHIPVVIKKGGCGARCYVQYTPVLRLVLHVSGRISQVRAQAATAHEISHLKRWQAGRQWGLQLFQWGTAGVLPQEEGGAIAAAMEHRQQVGKAAEGLLPSQLLLCATQAAHTLGFLEVCAYLHTLAGGKLTYEKLFTLAARAKRGVADVSRGGAYPKGSVYRVGYQEFVSARGDDPSREKFCTYGKIKRSDSDLLEPLF